MEEVFYYHAVAAAVAGDYAKIEKLKKGFGDWKSAYDALVRSGASRLEPEKEWEKLSRAGIGLVLHADDRYPRLLVEIADPPFGIYVRGTLPPEGRPSLAIVGTRRATPDGKRIARRFASELARSGFTIVSGLAFGIDAAAHEGCLEAEGVTVAVLAGGLDAVYPRENERLAAKILERGGAIVSEYPPGSPPYPGRFLERNRIISGLTQGVLIVEAPKGSGSLATARRALEQNRDVFVVPGPVAHPNFAGSHQLIRQGAELVTAPEEILEAYGMTREETIAAQERTASREEMLILKALQEVRAPADVDKIAVITKLNIQIVNCALSSLILRNLVKESGGGYTI